MSQIYFDFKKSPIYKFSQAYYWLSKSYFRALVFILYSFGGLSLIFLILKTFSVFYFFELEPLISAEKITHFLSKTEFFKIAFFFFFLFLFLVSWTIYYKNQIKNPPFPPLSEKAKKGEIQVNLADYLSTTAGAFIYNLLRKTKKKDLTSDFFLREVLKEKEAQFLLERIGIKLDKFRSGLCDFYQRNPKEKINLSKLIFGALSLSLLLSRERIELLDLFGHLIQVDPYSARMLFGYGLEADDIVNIIFWHKNLRQRKQERKFNPDRLKLKGGIGRNFAAAYTRYLPRFTVEITEAIAKFGFPLHIIGHEANAARLEKVLARSKNHNVILVGPAGVGKKTCFLSFSQKVYQGQTYRKLANRRILQLNLDRILGGAQNVSQIIRRLNMIFFEACYAGNIILFIENLESLFGQGEERVGAIDASEIILPYLDDPNLYFVATSTDDAFLQYIEPKKHVLSRFEKIEIGEPDQNQTIRILEDIVPFIEKKSKVFILYESLKAIVRLSERFIYDKPFPEKAIDLLDEVIVYAQRGKEKKICLTSRLVEEVVSLKVKIPVGDLSGTEREKLLNLEAILQERVIGQSEAISVVASALRRARAGVRESKKPIGSFLFLGPTGVGKTETCKALAKVYFGSEANMIRFDMSEYQDKASIYRLLGSTRAMGEETLGELTQRVKENPFSLLLFDEIEKAHPDLLNIFLQILDEGWVTDALGRKIKFNNTIIIATSNAGAQLIQKGIKEKLPSEVLKEKLIDFLQRERIFRPEFLNRFTSLVYFKPLSFEDIKKITRLIVQRLIRRIEKEKGIFLEISDQVIEKLARQGYDPKFGARPIERVIQEKVENILARKIIADEVGRGSKVKIEL